MAHLEVGEFLARFEFIDIPGLLLYDTANGTAFDAIHTPFSEKLTERPHVYTPFFFNAPYYPCLWFDFQQGDKDCPNFNFAEIDWDGD